MSLGTLLRGATLHPVEDAFRMLTLAAVRLAVGEQPSEELFTLAADALALGVDSPALREAAGVLTRDVALETGRRRWSLPR
jgi:hypothetical protein